MDYDELTMNPLMAEIENETVTDLDSRNKTRRYWTPKEEDHFFEIWGRENWRLTRYGKNTVFFAQWSDEMNDRWGIDVKPEEVQAKVNQIKSKYRQVTKTMEMEKSNTTKWKKFEIINKILRNEYRTKDAEAISPVAIEKGNSFSPAQATLSQNSKTETTDIDNSDTHHNQLLNNTDVPIINTETIRVEANSYNSTDSQRATSRYNAESYTEHPDAVKQESGYADEYQQYDVRSNNSYQQPQPQQHPQPQSPSQPHSPSTTATQQQQSHLPQLTTTQPQQQKPSPQQPHLQTQYQVHPHQHSQKQKQYQPQSQAQPPSETQSQCQQQHKTYQAQQHQPKHYQAQPPQQQYQSNTAAVSLQHPHQHLQQHIQQLQQQHQIQQQQQHHLQQQQQHLQQQQLQQHQFQQKQQHHPQPSSYDPSYTSNNTPNNVPIAVVVTTASTPRSVLMPDQSHYSNETVVGNVATVRASAPPSSQQYTNNFAVPAAVAIANATDTIAIANVTTNVTTNNNNVNGNSGNVQGARVNSVNNTSQSRKRRSAVNAPGSSSTPHDSLESLYLEEVRRKNFILDEHKEISRKRLQLEERKIALMEQFFPKILDLQEKILNKLN